MYLSLIAITLYGFFSSLNHTFEFKLSLLIISKYFSIRRRNRTSNSYFNVFPYKTSIRGCMPFHHTGNDSVKMLGHCVGIIIITTSRCSKQTDKNYYYYKPHTHIIVVAPSGFEPDLLESKSSVITNYTKEQFVSTYN